MPEPIRFHRTPLAGVDAMTATTARSFPRHIHDQYGIGVIDSGGHASLSGRGQVEAGPGSLIFVNPGEVHDGRPIAGRPRSWRMFYVDPITMDELRTDIDEDAMASFAFAGPVFSDATLRRLFDVAFVHATATSGSRDTMGCETSILRLTERIKINSTSKRRDLTNATPCIQRALELIHADPSSAEITLARLAKETGISKYQLIRGFVRELGLTPHAYIHQLRLGLARRLIRAGTGLADAAISAGFFDQSHLTHSFARQFGVTPRRYTSVERTE